MADYPEFPVVPGVEILEVIGRGGFATVYSGFQAAFNRHVAVKVLQRSQLDADARRRFDRECQVMGALSNHPYIVTLYVAGYTENERPYMVMPYVREGTLDDRIRNGGPVPWQEVVRMGVHLSGALETAHRAGVLHRDIKPANVLRAEYGDLLGDFGIARIAGGHETQSGVITASIAHAPPEVLEGETPSPRGDVYSLGSTLFEALAGRAAFSQTSDAVGFASMMRRILLDPPPTLPDDAAPSVVADVIQRALSKDSSDRQATAQQFGEELQSAQRSMSTSPTDMLIIGPAAAGLASVRTDPEGGPISVEAPRPDTVTPVEPRPPPGPPAPPVHPKPPAPPVHPEPPRPPAHPEPVRNDADATRYQARLPPSVPPASPGAPASRDGTSRTGRRWFLAAAAGLVVLAGLAVAFVVSGGGDDDEPSASGPTAASVEVDTSTVASADTSNPTDTTASTEQESSATADTTPPTTEPPAPAPLVLPPGEPVDLQLLNPGIQTDVLETLVAEFEGDNPDISVEILDGGNYPDSLEALANGSIEPDVALLADRAVQTVLDQVDYIPMHEFIENDDFDSTRLLANTTDMYATPDGLAGMPYNVAVPMVYANATLLAEAGIDIDSMANLTTGGLLDRCALLTDVVPTCVEFGTSAFLFTELITNSGGRVFDTLGFDGSASAVGFDTPIGRAAFDFLSRPVIEGVFEPRSSAELFESGQAAFYMNTSSVLGRVDRDFAEQDGTVELVSFDLPHLDGGQANGIIPGGGALWILDRGDERRATASWLLVEYLVGLEPLSTYHQASGYVPGRTDAPESAAFTDFWAAKPVFRGAYDELVEASTTALPNERDGRAGPLHTIDRAIEDRLEQAQTGELSIDEAFDALVADVNALLADYSAANP